MKYDQKVIEEFAGRLYSRARSIIVTHTFLGVIIGFGGGAFLGRLVFAVIGAVILGIIGHSMGVEKAFKLKLQAQTALCQVQIEKNTRALNS